MIVIDCEVTWLKLSYRVWKWTTPSSNLESHSDCNNAIAALTFTKSSKKEVKHYNAY